MSEQLPTAWLGLAGHVGSFACVGHVGSAGFGYAHEPLPQNTTVLHVDRMSSPYSHSRPSMLHDEPDFGGETGQSGPGCGPPSLPPPSPVPPSPLSSDLPPQAARNIDTQRRTREEVMTTPFSNGSASADARVSCGIEVTQVVPPKTRASFAL